MNDTLPKLTRADVTLLSAWNYYDGPLSGVLRWQGKRYWFDALWGEGNDHDPYELLDLDAAQWRLADEVHELFCRNVGTHWEYDEVTQRLGARGHREGADMAAYYDDPRVVDWEDPTGPVVAYLRLYSEWCSPSDKEGFEEERCG